MDEWFWEGNVQQTLADYLRRAGWSILRMSHTASREQGDDLVCRQAERLLRVEVKGFPSRYYQRGEKRGQVKPTQTTTEARQFFSHALLWALAAYDAGDAEIALAFPNFPTYRNQLARVRAALRRLGIGVYVINESGTVELALAHEPALNSSSSSP